MTRKCPMNCSYCSIVDNNKEDELTLEQWKKAFLNLKNIGVDFNLILGNEVLMLKDDLIELVKFLKEENISYGMYSTFPEPFYTKYRDQLIEAGMENLSFGCDTLVGNDSIGIKSRRALNGVKYLVDKGLTGHHASVTISDRNIDEVEDMVKTLTENKVWSGLNTIHWNKDGKYDFFPPKKDIEDLIIKDTDKLKRVCNNLKEKTISGEYMIQTPTEYFDAIVEHGLDMSWHCSLPLMITVDSDGSLRLCGYRAGEDFKKFNILDMDSKEKLQEYHAQWDKEKDDCPGCFWACWWQAEQTVKGGDEEFGKELFQSHKSKHFNKEENE